MPGKGWELRSSLLLMFSFGLLLGLVLSGSYGALPGRAEASDRSWAEHLQIGGEWCFIAGPKTRSSTTAVVLLHGNGETVGPETSNWEQNPGTRHLMNQLIASGFLVAQSNATAAPSNGMWGNSGTQEAVLALFEYLRSKRGVTKFNAIALSAGNLTLLNVALSGKARFDRAVLAAPVISLASLYRCPSGFDRVGGISRAFGFTPLHGCPGDPRQDIEFIHHTDGFDPLRTITEKPAALARLSATQWMTCYEENDPKVPPDENILALRDVFEKFNIGLRRWMLPGAATHTSQKMLEGCTPEVVRFFTEQKKPQPIN